VRTSIWSKQSGRKRGNQFDERRNVAFAQGSQNWERQQNISQRPSAKNQESQGSLLITRSGRTRATDPRHRAKRSTVFPLLGLIPWDCALLLAESRFLRRMISTGLVIGLAARQERECKQSKQQITFHRFVKTTGSPTDTRAKFSGPLDKNSAVQLFLSTETTLSSLMVSLFFSTFR